MTERGGVNIRAQHTVSEVCGPAAQRPPRLLSSCQLIKAKSLPIPAGKPHQTARGAFYPEQNAAPRHSGGSAASRTRTPRSLTRRSESRYPAKVAALRHKRGKRWKGHQEKGILKDTACLRQAGKPDDTRQAVNVTVHSFDLVPIPMSHN